MCLGTVMFSDGSLPVDNLIGIWRNCNGVSVFETYANRRGRFRFPMNIRRRAFVGASAMRNTWRAGFPVRGSSPCWISVDVPGYWSRHIILGPSGMIDDPDLGVIVLHPLGYTEGSTVSIHTLTAPDEAKKAYRRGLKELRKPDRDIPKAIKRFQKAVDLHPEYAPAWAGLAEAYLFERRRQQAREALQHALEIDPMYLRPQVVLSRLSIEEKDWDAAVGYADQALTLNPFLTQIRYYRAVANHNRGDHSASLNDARGILSGRDARYYPQVQSLIGSIHAAWGDYSAADESYRAYLKAVPNSPAAGPIQSRLARWRLSGRIPSAQ